MPRATINIGEASGQAATGAIWRYSRGYVPGEDNEGLVAQGEGSPARLPEYDDSNWEVCSDLAQRVSRGFSFVWYRATITIPETVDGPLPVGCGSSSRLAWTITAKFGSTANATGTGERSKDSTSRNGSK